MHPAKVDRKRLKRLTDLPNIGPAMAGDLVMLGIQTPQDVKGHDPYALYCQLCQMTGVRHDPCVLDVFMSITSFMNGGKAAVWWEFTEKRKKLLQKLGEPKLSES